MFWPTFYPRLPFLYLNFLFGPENVFTFDGMTRNRINRNPKLTREQLIDINKQHVIQASLLINHMEAAENRIRELEKKNKRLMEQEEGSKKKIQELEDEAKKRSKETEHKN